MTTIITFNFNSNTLSYIDWILFGAAQSKCRHLSSVALDPKSHSKLLKIYMTKGIQGTAAIEGNTLSVDEIEK
ncbi:MAG: hypothetical protein FWF87_04580 [Synergistaceae bacterium]|nr:hypothetical protein [Synergistaceae bacterium]